MGDREMMATKPRNRHAKDVRENPQYAERVDRGTKMKAYAGKPKYADWKRVVVEDDDDFDDDID